MRYFLDEDLSDEVARIARNLGLDVCSVHEVNREELCDPEQFDYATEHNMVMVTRNRDDFLALNDEHFLAGTPNCGLLIVPHTLPNNRRGSPIGCERGTTQGKPLQVVSAPTWWTSFKRSTHPARFSFLLRSYSARARRRNNRGIG
jgi:predicted nuclease of predicted toxin-antitoxin system